MSKWFVGLAFTGAVLGGVQLEGQVRSAPVGGGGAASPEALATAVMRAFESGTPAEFAALFPDSAGRTFMRSRAPKRAELARVIRREPGRAVLLLAGTTRSGGGGSQTNSARHFSGFYEAVESRGTWRVARQIPFDTANHIREQRLRVDVLPGERIDVVDTLTLTIGAAHGFGFRINNDVKFKSVELDGHSVEYAFGGGVVWLDAPRAAEARLVLAYSLAASRDSAGAPAFGAFHNTDIWHPAFDYLSPNHLAHITAVVRIPAEYKLSTTLPQTDTVRSGIRTVYGESRHRDFLLALIFDRDWEPQTTDLGSLRFESFTTPAFRHSHDTLAARVRHLHGLLAPRFGEPRVPDAYLAAVEDRALGPRGGFSVFMNSAAVSGGGGGNLGSVRGQVFAHETGHAWTMNATGRASNFLHESWSKYVESVVLRDLYGSDAERDYWEAQRNAYMVGNDRGGWAGGFEGRQSILADADNGRLHYTKGPWVLHAAQWVMGDTAFDRGMRYFIDGMGKGPGGYEELIAAWSRAAGRSMKSFVMPWLTSRYIPDVEARVEGGLLIVTQEQRGENFDLPRLEIELATEAGPVLRTLDLRDRADTLSIEDLGDVTEVRVDPNHRYLMHRKWGETVSFALPATSLPGAEAVQLAADFVRQGVTLPATKVADTWVVEVPLTDGVYTWLWSEVGRPPVPGGAEPNPALTGTRVVRPLQRIQDPYPGR